MRIKLDKLTKTTVARMAAGMPVNDVRPRDFPHRNLAGQVVAVPVATDIMRQGSSPAWAETPGGSGLRRRSLEPGRSVGWGDGWPDMPDRGAQDHSQEPCINLVITRWMCCRQRYCLSVRITTRDDQVERCINRHYLGCTVTYLDTETRRAWIKKAEALAQEQSDNWGAVDWLNSVSITDAVFLGAWIGLKRVFHSHSNSGLEVTLGKLLGCGMDLWADDFDLIRELERSIIWSIDKIETSIAVAQSFSDGETAIYGPGKKTKGRREDDDGVSPQDWENS